MNDEQKARRDALANAHWLKVGTGKDCASADFKAGYDTCFQEAEKLVAALEWIAQPYESPRGYIVAKNGTALREHAIKALQSWREGAK